MNIKTRPLSQSELLLLFGFSSPTWKAIFTIAYITALRVSDLINLTFDNIVGDRLEVVEQKTGKSKSIVIGPSLRMALDYFSKPATRIQFSRMYSGDRENHLLPFSDPSSYRKAIVRYCALARIPLDRIAFHSLRKTAATAIAQNIGIIAANQFLGHSKLSTTMDYVEINSIEVSNLLEAREQFEGRMKS